MSRIVEQLNIQEREYFGLLWTDESQGEKVKIVLLGLRTFLVLPFIIYLDLSVYLILILGLA